MAWNIRRSAADRAHSRMLSSKTWKKYSLAFRDKHPICAVPGCYEPAEVTDHIKPAKGDRTLFWDKSNHQSLCKRHHDDKTRAEQAGKDIKVKGCDDDGNPTDPEHPWNKKG